MKKAILFITACIFLCGVAGAQEKVRNPKDKTQYNSVFDLLRAEPGVIVSPGGGNGDMPKILIRGVSTNSDQTQPLFVVDGIITDNVTYLRPEDIYSVEVLTDGTAGISGVQGQHGVRRCPGALCPAPARPHGSAPLPEDACWSLRTLQLPEGDRSPAVVLQLPAERRAQASH